MDASKKDCLSTFMGVVFEPIGGVIQLIFGDFIVVFNAKIAQEIPGDDPSFYGIFPLAIH